MAFKMCFGLIVVLSLLRNNGRDSSRGGWIAITQNAQLMFQVFEYDGFNRDRRRGNGAPAKKTRDHSEQVTADAAEPIAATAWASTALQFSEEDRPVLFFFRTKLDQLLEQAPGGDSSHENLAGIDIDGAVLASMVDLDDAVAKVGSK